MKIEKERLDDHQVKLTVEFEPAPLEKAKRQAARKLAKRTKIPGFRPGKAPYGVIVKHFGEGTILEDAIDIMIQDVYPKVIDEAEIKPYGPGNLENIPTLEPPTFEFVVPLEPEVELGDYKTLDFPYELPEITDEDVNKEIEVLRERHATRETVERPAEEGDVVFLRVTGKKVDVEEDDEDDGVLFEGRFSSTTILSKDVKDEDEWPFKGFSRKLIGVTADDEKTITYTYPKKYKDENLRGVKAQFTVNVTNVQSQSLPELNDEFAKLASDSDTYEELVEDTKNRLQGEIQTEYDQEYDEQILDHLVGISTLKYPPQMLEREKDEMISNLEYRLSQQGITKEMYLQIRGIDEEGLLEEVAPIAETRLKRGLIMLEVASAEEIQIDQDQLNAQARQTVNMITSQMTPKDAKDFQKSEYLANMVNSMVADMMTQKTMDYLRAVAQGLPWPPGEEVLENENPEDETDEAEDDAGEAPSETVQLEDVEEPAEEQEADSKTEPVVKAEDETPEEADESPEKAEATSNIEETPEEE